MARPPATAPRTARELALKTLIDSARTGEFPTQVLEIALDRIHLDEPERRLTVELVNGVVRRQGTLDALLQPLLKRPLAEIEDGLRWVLRLGAYQLALLSGIPPHAAVHETVETARRIGEPRWAGFVNGVLRTLSRLLTEERTDSPSANAVPLARGEFRTLASPLLPNPATQPVEYFASAFGFPLWLAKRWARRFSIDELHRLGFWFNSPPPPSLRVNLLRTSRDAFLARLSAASIPARPGDFPEAVLLHDRVRIESLPGFADGDFSVQDESAMGAARLLDPQPGESILDLCAAPGGKSTHLAELMHNSGRIVAADVDAGRVRLIAENSRRLRADIIEPFAIRRDLSDLPAEQFDAVLLDVPCSNTGVLGKRPEARWRLQPADLEDLTSLQRRLLSTAIDHVKPGGRIVYSTCSIEPEENEGVVQSVLSARPEWQVARQTEHLPGRPADGAWQALILPR